MSKNYFVTAIGTDSGKTLVSAIMVEALQADYWKPIQAGRPTDSEQVRKWVNTNRIIHPEGVSLETPASPHAAAAKEGTSIQLANLIIPDTSNTLVIEGAGGMLVPVNDNEVVIDMVPMLNASVIVVCDLYLGSINHSLLTLEALKLRGYPIEGIIFNGPTNKASEEIILSKTGLKCLLKIEKEENITKEIVNKYAKKLTNNWP